MKVERLKKSEKIKNSYDIRTLFKNGKKIIIPGAKFFFARNEQCLVRIAFVFSRNFGNAVKKNRSKRFCKEAFRLLKSRLYKGVDIVFFIYPVEKDLFALRYGQFEELCKKAGLLKN